MSYSEIQYILATFTFMGILIKVGHVIYKFCSDKLKQITEDRSKLNKIFEEMTPNHGSSLKDKINKLEKSIEKNTELTEKIFYRQRWIMEHQDLPIFESDNDGLCSWVNERYARLFGKSSSNFLGNSWKNIIHPDDRERVELHWGESVRDKIDAEDTFRALSNDKIIKIRIIANKIESGYIGSVQVLED